MKKMAVYAENRKAHFIYEILEKFQAGLALNGQEVKSIKAGRIQLAGAYVIPRGEELFLVGAHVPAYQPANAPADYNPERDRKLLLHKEEIRYLLGKAKEKGLTLAPLRVYTDKRNLKLEVGLARGKKKVDKREVIKKREAEREIERALKMRW
ncbi:MAG: SsrA-binding protein [Candidatus Wildermuthbacteria bacterium RIFCSPLOWO2_02_FULL_47_9c]|uniref:SsrA-binding protein n=2 Tax=Parcubacteria group TaxID=1794811 RepID=A0A1G2RX17_9BACT|nr:MAG: SsrA-binding protein [Candidatus Wildermuthbacteria bacterium GWA1_49_26]OHA65342.1 MAG: SsrA-binding protein [Candidatus Wildermuthbacteria bacterium RIFCSPHIGHO2_01_FULL_50_47]OHA69536.1 MAG: SsrA-binding protein [Candidatus Wildermuthbacteria bacterium RIFCSPHIGHO2_02_FULL_49_17]OHA72180.1 MAG: SsrA-binding protein [Candidatus Wildermuthbacteria bacterium RIFCSPHIGHO2_12_FULL_49_13]OHA74698.1 MAG: SsrA-binding protein [Candidatus Wildermuthbacteria bacterium RIFCSPLOWO2_01_FULL_50_46